LVLNWILSKQPETVSAHASVKYHTRNLNHITTELRAVLIDISDALKCSKS